MRPRIVCHMMGSIDGRLLPDRWTPPARGIDRASLIRHYDAVAARFGSSRRHMFWHKARVREAEAEPDLFKPLKGT